MSFAKTFTPLRSVLIGTRLRWCFIFVVLLIAAGCGLMLWQFSYVRYEREHMLGVDQELIAVLRFQTHLRSFHAKLNELAQADSVDQLVQQSAELEQSLIAPAAETQAAFAALPPSARPDPTVLATLEAIQSSLPGHLEAIRTLASTGDWTALRVRLKSQVEPLESLSSELVQDVDRSVAADRTVMLASIARAQQRLMWIIPVSLFVTLLFAIFLGVVITQSITDPLQHLMNGSKALARGEFAHEIQIDGKDELAQL